MMASFGSLSVMRIIAHSACSGFSLAGWVSLAARALRWAVQLRGAISASDALARSASAVPPSFFRIGTSALSVSFTSARSAISAGKFLPISQSRRPTIAHPVVPGSGGRTQTYGQQYLELHTDTLDSLAFPSRGQWTTARIEWLHPRGEASVINASLLGLSAFRLGEWAGQLWTWTGSEAIKAHCAACGATLHMDGERLWEAAVGYGKPLNEVAAGFDSAYVSLYKGIGGLGGTILGTTNKKNPLAYPARTGGGTEDYSARCVETFHHLTLDALLVIGGDGTLAIHPEFPHRGLPLLGLPQPDHTAHTAH